MSPQALANDLVSQQSLGALRGACELCHRHKEKCILEHGQQACRKCRALKTVCVLRKKKRMGRRPGPERFPHGSCSILELNPETHEHQETDKSKEGYQSANSQPIYHDAEPTNWAPLAHNFTEYTLNSSMSEPSSQCQSLKVAPLTGCSSYSYTLKAPIEAYPGLGYVLATKEGFFDAHRQFMLGRSFIDEYQHAVQLLFTRAPQALGLVYSATLHLLNHRKERPGGVEGPDVSLGSQCLGWLIHGSSRIKEMEDAAVVLMMGQTLMVYNTLLPSPSSRTIIRGALLSTMNWYPTLLQQPNLDPITLTPILLDTVDCLIRRQTPIVRFPTAGRLIVDRLIGLCSTLLPLLFDLCDQSHQAKIKASTLPLAGSNSDPYIDLERKISSWTPRLSPDLFLKYQASEIAAMSAQARSYRTAALLIIHRLRFPLGTEDSVGYSYAESILNELSFMKHWPIDGATGLGLDFPLMVAMLEIPSSAMELFRAFDTLRYQRHLSESFIEFVGSIRKAYDEGYGGLWLDLVTDEVLDLMIP
ncbi:hypothetical protein BGZ61DRAFT_445635 [Ilyonectria robusta]|uniref:uncharacterized protein n=1 Tax=Ilyonectria robusta TaxID=1079257 RepID=UPI001E8DC290|nr:uncharacterized protein BGZ61DRAFT_445635 [Ilyonectria robusta]KAH8733977.1 hypothetical protein BGZ61DRAFT_445635 [Ilyonectria robusta]